jgi:hypothetical protein
MLFKRMLVAQTGALERHMACWTALSLIVYGEDIETCGMCPSECVPCILSLDFSVFGMEPGSQFWYIFPGSITLLILCSHCCYPWIP